MGKKKSKKQFSKKHTKYPLIIAGGLLILLITGGLYKKKYRKDELAKGSFTTVVTIDEISRKWMGKPWLRKDVVHFYFVKNDTVYHISENYTRGTRKKWDLQPKKAYEIEVAESDYEIFEVDFSKPIDTVIDISKYIRKE